MWTDRIEDLVNKHPQPWELHELFYDDKTLGKTIIDANGQQVKLDEIIDAFNGAGSENGKTE